MYTNNNESQFSFDTVQILGTFVSHLKRLPQPSVGSNESFKNKMSAKDLKTYHIYRVTINQIIDTPTLKGM